MIIGWNYFDIKVPVWYSHFHHQNVTSDVLVSFEKTKAETCSQNCSETGDE